MNRWLYSLFISLTPLTSNRGSRKRRLLAIICEAQRQQAVRHGLINAQSVAPVLAAVQRIWRGPGADHHRPPPPQNYALFINFTPGKQYEKTKRCFLVMKMRNNVGKSRQEGNQEDSCKKGVQKTKTGAVNITSSLTRLNSLTGW